MEIREAFRNIIDRSEFLIEGSDLCSESVDVEYKSASKGLLESMWSTYSAFANTEGGIIVLGVSEVDGKPTITGIADPDKMVQDIWTCLHNHQKVSVNLIQDIKTLEVDGKSIIILEVPRADRRLRPVFINGRRDDGTFRRGGEGDFMCTMDEIDSMIRDNVGPIDRSVLTNMGIDDLDMNSVIEYRNELRSANPDSILNRLEVEDFLKAIGAMDSEGGESHLTVAGLLMFGRYERILRWNGSFNLDYLECTDAGLDWEYRLSTRDTTWVGNIYNFYSRVVRRLSTETSGTSVPNGFDRIMSTDLQTAIREALLNALINNDYAGREGVRLVRRIRTLTVSNYGDFHIPLEKAEAGGHSDPRNPTLARMFDLIGKVERIGVGVLRIMSIWESNGLARPEYVQEYGPPRVVLRLSFMSASSDSKADESIMSMMEQNDRISVSSMAEKLDLTPSAVYTRIQNLKAMGVVERSGGTRGRWVVRRRRA